MMGDFGLRGDLFEGLEEERIRGCCLAAGRRCAVPGLGEA